MEHHFAVLDIYPAASLQAVRNRRRRSRGRGHAHGAQNRRILFKFAIGLAPPGHAELPGSRDEVLGGGGGILRPKERLACGPGDPAQVPVAQQPVMIQRHPRAANTRKEFPIFLHSRLGLVKKLRAGIEVVEAQE